MVAFCRVTVTPVTPPSTHTHTPLSAIIENRIEPTCEKEGSYDLVVYCSECGEEIERNVVSIRSEYNLIFVNRNLNTCTEDGNIAHYHCSVCNKNFNDANATTEVLDITIKVGHKYENKVCTVCGYVKPSEGLEFTLNDDGKSYSVTGIGTCTDTDLVIASTYNSLPVTSIGYSAFMYCNSLTSITFKDTSTWYRTTSKTDWQNKVGGTITDLSNPTQNATYFSSTYYNYYWYKK